MGGYLTSLSRSTNDVYLHDGISVNIDSFFSAPFSSSNGLGFVNPNLLNSDSQSDLIYIHDKVTVAVLSSFASPATVPWGLAYVPPNLISCDSTSNLVYIHDGVTSTILSSFLAPGGDPRGLATADGVNMIVASLTTIYVCVGVSVTVDYSFSSPGSNLVALAVDTSTGNLISTAVGTSLIYVHDKLTSTILESFAIPAASIYGLAYIPAPFVAQVYII